MPRVIEGVCQVCGLKTLHGHRTVAECIVALKDRIIELEAKKAGAARA